MKSEWKEHKVGEFVSFQNGFAFKSKDFSSGGKYKIIKIKELKDGMVKFFADSAQIDVKRENDFDKYRVYNGDILFALTGDPVSKPNPLSWVGRVSIYNHSVPALLNQRVCKVIFTDKIYPLFFYYYFRKKENFFALAAKATGSASQANISTSTISDMPIFLPNYESQKAIADILYSIDDRIALNTAINENLQRYAA